MRGLGSDDLDMTLAGTRAASLSERITLGPAVELEAREEFERLMASWPPSGKPAAT